MKPFSLSLWAKLLDTDMAIFQLALLDEAKSFLQSLPKQAYKKILYNVDKDEKTLVIATHGIIKKSQKTPGKEIAKAEAIMKQYFELKKNE